MDTNFVIPAKIGKYRFHRAIGKGSTSNVYTVLSDDNREKLCCKVISKQIIQSESSIKHLRSEISNILQCDHPNILRITDIMQDSTNFYIITEFCSKGTLYELITTETKLSEEQSKDIFHQVISALEYLHQIGIVHRDIKPENIYIDNNNMVRIGDLGLSSVTIGLLTTQCGTLTYCSPEIISNSPYDGKLSDIWSCGVLLYVMVTGRVPWTAKQTAILTEQIKKAKIAPPTGISAQCLDLITKMMAVDPEKRPSCQEILNHPWLVGSDTCLVASHTLPSIRPQLIGMFFDDTNEMSSLPTLKVNRKPDRGEAVKLLNTASRKPPKRKLHSVPASPIRSICI